MVALIILGAGIRVFDLERRYEGFRATRLFFDRGGEAAAIASSLHRGRGFSNPFWVETGPTALEPPVYPALLAGLDEIFGDRTPTAQECAQMLNVAFSVAVIPILYELGTVLAGSGPGLLAAFLWACWPVTGYTEVYYVWNTSLYCFLFCLSVLLAVQKRWQFALVAGIAVLVDPSAVVVGLLVVWLWFTGNRRLAVCAGLSCALIAAPWMWRNAAVLGQPALRSGLGMNLLRGIDDRDFSPAATAAPLYAGRNPDELDRYRSMGELEYDARCLRLAWAAIRNDPAAYLRTAAHRFVVFWSGDREIEILYAGLPYKHVLHLLPACMALAGICVLFASRAPSAALFGAVFLLQPAIYYFTLPVPRYRAPLETLAMVLGAIALTRAAQWLRAGGSAESEEMNLVNSPNSGIFARASRQ